MELRTNPATQALIAQMETDINRLKQISAAYNQLPMTMENSAACKRLYDQFDEEKALFYSAYGQDKSFRLEALNEALFLEFNQYLVEHVGSIRVLHLAPTFMEYMFLPSDEEY